VCNMTKPNIIFLDFDGVICNPNTCLAMGNTGHFSYLDPVSLNLVKRLCVEHNCRIVISSSWRNLYDKFSIKAILNAACPNLGQYVIENNEAWKTVSLSGVTTEDHGRGKEIYWWIKEHSSEFNNFVILDDDADMEPLFDNFVQTDHNIGFTFNDFEKAVVILKRSPDEN